jgi:hypothetical protein
MTDDPTDIRHYMKLPICGYCINAWDIIFKRPPWDERHGHRSPEAWLEHCHVGGCDPDVWEFLGDDGWPLPKPKPDNRLYHRRDRNSDTARWRKFQPKLVTAWAALRDSKYTAVLDEHGRETATKVVPDESISWGDEEDEPLVDADGIEW